MFLSLCLLWFCFRLFLTKYSVCFVYLYILLWRCACFIIQNFNYVFASLYWLLICLVNFSLSVMNTVLPLDSREVLGPCTPISNKSRNIWKYVKDKCLRGYKVYRTMIFKRRQMVLHIWIKLKNFLDKMSWTAKYLQDNVYIS